MLSVEGKLSLFVPLRRTLPLQTPSTVTSVIAQDAPWMSNCWAAVPESCPPAASTTCGMMYNTARGEVLKVRKL